MSDLAQTVKSFGAEHPLQILITAGLVVYSLAKNKLTGDGIVAAVVTAVIHMLHPWGVFFYLLVTFFMAGTVATKVCFVQLISFYHWQSQEKRSGCWLSFSSRWKEEGNEEENNSEFMEFFPVHLPRTTILPPFTISISYSPLSLSFVNLALGRPANAPLPFNPTSQTKKLSIYKTTRSTTFKKPC